MDNLLDDNVSHKFVNIILDLILCKINILSTFHMFNFFLDFHRIEVCLRFSPQLAFAQPISKF